MASLKTTPPSNAATLENWRGPAEIWTPDTYHLHLWPSATVRHEDKKIEVSFPKKQIRFSVSDIVEARAFRLPLPSLTLIFTLDESQTQNGLVSLFNLRRSVLEAFLGQTGLILTDERAWRTGLEAGRDAKTYALQS